MFNPVAAWTESTDYNSGDIVTRYGKQWKSTTDNNGTSPGVEGSDWIEYNPEWYTSETPFGDTVSWKRDDNRIYVKVEDSNGDVVAEFDVPVGEFAF
jgi:hypothetical protein